MLKESLGKLCVGNHSSAPLIGGLVLTFIYILIILLIGEYLWNNVLVKVCTIVKPVNSMWEILGIYVLLQILLGK